MKKRSRILTLFYMVLSCVVCSIAVNWVALPNGFVVTGITGLSMTAANFVGVNYALIYYGLMLLILLCTYLTLGYKEVSNIVVLSVLYPLVLWVLNHVQVEIILQDKLIAVMLFGVIYGVGAGITYRMGYSYGGTDTLSKILKKRTLKAAELKNIMFVLEGTIMVVMLSAFSLDMVAYAFVGQIIYINCMNYMVFNLGPKLYEVEIICDHPAEIERFIIDEIHKSATIDQVIGGYSKEPKTQLDCVCNSGNMSSCGNLCGIGTLTALLKSIPSPMSLVTTRISTAWTMKIWNSWTEIEEDLRRLRPQALFLWDWFVLGGDGVQPVDEKLGTQAGEQTADHPRQDQIGQIGHDHPGAHEGGRYQKLPQIVEDGGHRAAQPDLLLGEQAAEQHHNGPACKSASQTIEEGHHLSREDCA